MVSTDHAVPTHLPDSFTMTEILDLPAEIILDIVISSATMPGEVDRYGVKVKSCGKSTDMYNLARSCKQLYAIFKHNEYSIFSRIVRMVIPRDGISYDRALKLLHSSWSRRHHRTPVAHHADVRDLLRPNMYGRFLRIARDWRIQGILRYLKTRVAEDTQAIVPCLRYLNEIDPAGELNLDHLWWNNLQARITINRVWDCYEPEAW